MSWFNDLTSKAEAMLIKLDKDAAQALQDPNGLLNGTKLLDHAINSVTNSRNNGYQGEGSLISTRQSDNNNGESDINIINDQYNLSTSWASGSSGPNDEDHQNIPSNLNMARQRVNEKPGEQSEQATNQLPVMTNNDTASQAIIMNKEDKFRDQVDANNQMISTTPPNQDQQARKFKLRTSKLRYPNEDKTRRLQNVTKNETKGGISLTVSPHLTSPGADDIRASINQTLQEYSLSSSTHEQHEPGHSSFYDDQPNLIQISSQISPDNDSPINRIQNSPSFSINLHDSQAETSGASTDIASRLIRQSAKKRSTFSLHHVINRLANQGAQTSSLMIDERMKQRLRRVQMRAAGYTRRMNYYFRAYPTLKYWLIGYIVVMQLLVVYVLFFYQSSGTTTAMFAQPDQQHNNSLGS